MAVTQPNVVAVRAAVRAALTDLPPDALVLVACSGGADSLALAAALAAEANAATIRAGSLTVNHNLQPESATVADTVVQQCRTLGLNPQIRVDIQVDESGAGPEGDARRHRYAAMDLVLERQSAAAVLLGHTLDDQAEQVLLGLARGSGARSLSGMPRVRGHYRRPLLDITRAQTEAACAELGLDWWTDPMNADPAYTRVRARRLLTTLEAELGPGVSAALARSADLLRADADHLDALAEIEILALGPGPWAVHELAELPPAIRGRVWRRLLLAAGAPAGQVSARHTDACDRLLTDWRGQGPVHAPGPILVHREGGQVHMSPTRPVE